MSLSHIRSYINSRMPTAAPGLSEWLNSLEDIENVPKTQLDNTYIIEIGDISSDHDDKSIEDSAAVVITIFKQAFNDQPGTRDTLLDLANCIRLDLANVENVEVFRAANSSPLTQVDSISMLPQPISESNDDILKIAIGFSFRLFFGIN